MRPSVRRPLAVDLDGAVRQIGEQRKVDLELGVDLAVDAVARQPGLLQEGRARAADELHHGAEPRLRGEDDLAGRNLAHDVDGGEAAIHKRQAAVGCQNDPGLGNDDLERVVLDARRGARRRDGRQVVDYPHLQVADVHQERELVLLGADALAGRHLAAAGEAELAAEDGAAVDALADPFARARGDGFGPQRLQRVERHGTEGALEPRAGGLGAGDEAAGHVDLRAARAQLELAELDGAAMRQDGAAGAPLIKCNGSRVEFLGGEGAVAGAQLILPCRMLGFRVVGLGTAGDGDAAAAPAQGRRRERDLFGDAIVGELDRPAVDLERRLGQGGKAQVAVPETDCKSGGAHVAVARQLHGRLSVDRKVEGLKQTELRDGSGDGAGYKLADGRLERERAVAL